jgi:putative glutamine amidotransferase
MNTDALRLDVVDRAYGEAIRQAGGIPVVLPQSTEPLADISILGGLLLTGGGDVDPSLYGQVQSAETGGVDTERDRWEVELLRWALDLALPVLGICRGCQVLNVAHGGSLIQHLPHHSNAPHLVTERESLVHSVQIMPGSQLHAVEGSSLIGVNSVHHQAVDAIGENLRFTAWAEDGTVEAVEHAHLPVIGVQWHPENLLSHEYHRAVFRWLVDQAARFQASASFGRTVRSVAGTDSRG